MISRFYYFIQRLAIFQQVFHEKESDNLFHMLLWALLSFEEDHNTEITLLDPVDIPSKVALFHQNRMVLQLRAF